LHFALWAVCGALVGVCMNNAVCRDLGRWLDATNAGAVESQPADKIG
jgi:hypothetical protein